MGDRPHRSEAPEIIKAQRVINIITSFKIDKTWVNIKNQKNAKKKSSGSYITQKELMVRLR